jgi:hypothetical protein
MSKTNKTMNKIALTGLFAALSYVIFTYFQFKIALPGGRATSLHFGNAVCALGALLLGGGYGIGGALGMTIGDLFVPEYVMGAPKTFILKLCIGLVTGFLAHKIGKINKSTDQKHILMWTIIATVGGLLFNIIFDPLFSYYYNMLILGKSTAMMTLMWSIIATSINAVTSIIATIIIYIPLRNALIKSGLFEKI